MPKKSNRGWSQRDIAAQLNNSVIYSLHPASLKEIPEARLRQLREYAMAFAAPLMEHIEEGYLRPEEGVMVFASGALFIQLSQVMNTNKVPAADAVAALFKE